MRRTWIVVGAIAALVVLVVVAVLLWTRDDGSGRIETTAWADSVCSSLADWRSSITALADVSGGTLNAESLRQKLDDGEAATETLVADLRGLGTPDLEAGAEVEQALDDAVAGLQRSYRALQEAATSALEADSSADFLAALAGLGDDFQRLLEQVADTIATLQSASLFGESSAELERAFTDAESCRALRSDNG